VYVRVFQFVFVCACQWSKQTYFGPAQGKLIYELIHKLMQK